jgi:enoyl-CoA hydratase/carnithine racemase
MEEPSATPRTPIDDRGTDTRSGPPSLVIDAAGVATLRLNRPRHHNRLEPDDIAILDRMVGEIEATAAVRVAVLAATGKTFCAGYDLADLGAPADDPAEASGIDLLAAMIDRLERLRVPTICALNGPVFGGGTDLALACDFRLATPACRMMMPAGRFGLHYYHGGLRRYTERLGLAAAKRLFLLGETLDADAMLRIGYLDEILPDADALAARTGAMVETVLAAADPAILASMKQCLNRIAAGDRDPAWADAAWARTRRSPTVAAAVAAGRPRRKPAS